MPNLLYVARSSYSGSTVFTFLLNLHPKICTVGHMTGWRLGKGVNLRCSCGARVDSCPFFRHIHGVFVERQLPFQFDDFGTHYRLVSNERLNRCLTASMPLVHMSWIERVRDSVVRAVPVYGQRLAAQSVANLTLVEAALSYASASVFVENAQSAYRLRYLRRIPSLSVVALHLVRDFRGVALSNMKRRGWTPVFAMNAWLREQADIVRIMREVPSSMTVRYEDICDATNETLARVHGFLGLVPHPFDGDFKSVEHHILGNSMRLRDRIIQKDVRWQTELSASDLAAILRTAEAFVRKHQTEPLSRIIADYLNTK